MALLVNGDFVRNGSSSSGLIFDRLEITKPADKLDYILNNNLDTSGIQVAGFYKGNDTEYSRDVTSECVFNPPSGSPLPSKGTVPVTISCSDLENTCTTSYNVNVKLSVDRYGALSGSYEPAYYVIGASTGNYAIFGGGKTKNGIDDGVTAYDSDLVATTATSFSRGLCDSATASIGQYALIAGGETDNDTPQRKVYTYNISLVQGSASALSKGRYAVSGASNAEYAIFGGGYLYPNDFNTVEAYNANLVRTIPATLSDAKSSPGAASVNNTFVVFAGGGNESTVVDAYNTSLVKLSAGQLEVGRSPIGASTNSHAIFAGGSVGAWGSDVTDAYDSSLVRTTITPIAESRRLFAGASLNGYAIFAGGDTGNNYGDSTIVDTYNDTLIRNTPSPLSDGRHYLAEATVGDYAIFVGGVHKNNHSNATDIYYDYTKQEAV